MKDLEKQMSAILEEEYSRVKKATIESAQEAAELTVEKLKADSPRQIRKGGKYARAWRCKRRDNGMLVSFVVYNSRYPGLTMNLERGHDVHNQYGATGKRAEAIKHIQPAEQFGIEAFERGIEKRLRRG